jgi:hypothetical protein
MPVTVWNRERTQVKITIGDQKDVAAFVMTESSRTTVGITGNVKDIVRLD